ncbi:MAG: ATP-dependent zinc metalloprotease FtsH [Candidatus Paceibacterota bacterium]
MPNLNEKKPKNQQKFKNIKLNFSGDNKKGGDKNKQFTGNIISTLLIFLLLVTLYSFLADETKSNPTVPISEIASDVSSGLVTEISVQGDDLNVTYKAQDGAQSVVKKSKKETGTPLSQTLVNYGVKQESLKDVKISEQDPSGFFYWFVTLAPFLIPLVFVGIFLWFISRQVKGAGMQAFTFGQSRARMILPHDKKQRITFKEVAGAKEAKEELVEIVDFLKNPKKFLDIGARIPKGVILMGAAGTGKTLLARAVAGEAGVPFFSVSGSEFVEMFVGVGASRVRDLFRMAKQSAPSIIFIDEIDAVGRVRGTGIGGGNDEREQTLNQILVEMDGFEQTEKVIVMAATNRPDVLDPALLRPGRFDRRVVIDLPDRNDREEILKIHAREKPLAEDINLKVVAERTPGFSGADLQSLMNEGAILTARESRSKISQYDLIRSIEKVMLGPERKSHLLSKKEKEITAYHEAGHALLASVLPYADPVHKVSIISRGRAAGYTLKLPLEERKLQSKNEFMDDIVVSLGGYVVEKNIFGDLTTGSSNDLQVATALARDMVTKYGMSDNIGPIALESSGGRAMFGRGVENREYSEEVSKKIDSEVSKIMNDSNTKALSIITEHRKILNVIAEKLMEVETIEREEFEKILVANGIVPKKKIDIEHQA